MKKQIEKSVYILGSGSSLLDLTKEEIDFLNTQNTIAMNKYVLFWEKIGIFPKYYFLADIHFPAIKVFEESHKILRNHGKPVHYLLDESYKAAYLDGIGLGLNSLRWLKRAYQKRKEILTKNGYAYNPFLRIKNATFFKRPHDFDAPLVWAENLEEEMFFYRGSLSVLLNLIAVLNLGNTIKLLGVDLSSKNFFDAELKQRTELWDQWMKDQVKNPNQIHATALSLNGQGGIHTQWSFINENLNKKGIDIFCCSKESLLVKNEICSYLPIQDKASSEIINY